MELNNYTSYENTLNIDFGNSVVVYLFGGDWCKPCNNVFSTLKKINDCICYKISVENSDFTDFIYENNITSIPHMIVKYKKNEVTLKGERTREEFEELFTSLKTE